MQLDANQMIATLYVSHSLIDVDPADHIVKKIVDVSILKNERAGITGALMFTGINFSQYLEGSRREVFELMDVLRKDDRHKIIWFTPPKSIAVRRFEKWSMAYSGPSRYAGRNIDKILDRGSKLSRSIIASEIVEMMVEFVR